MKNHCYANDLDFEYYYFAKCTSLCGVALVMQAGLMKRPMTLEDIIKPAPEEQPKKRDSYKKQGAE